MKRPCPSVCATMAGSEMRAIRKPARRIVTCMACALLMALVSATLAIPEKPVRCQDAQVTASTEEGVTVGSVNATTDSHNRHANLNNASTTVLGRAIVSMGIVSATMATVDSRARLVNVHQPKWITIALEMETVETTACVRARLDTLELHVRQGPLTVQTNATEMEFVILLLAVVFARRIL